MTHTALSLTLASLLAFALNGCESCRRGEEPAPQPAPQAQPPTPGSPAASPPAAAMHTPDPEVVSDCFVFVDAEPDFGDAPLTAVFSTDVECGNKPVTYSWDFGDGTTGGNEANPSHTYEKPGDYVAVVTVRTADGAEGSDEIDIFVDEPAAK